MAAEFGLNFDLQRRLFENKKNNSEILIGTGSKMISRGLHDVIRDFNKRRRRLFAADQPIC